MLANKIVLGYINKCNKAGLSKGAQASLIGVSRTTLANWEATLKKEQTIDTLSSTIEKMLTVSQEIDRLVKEGRLPALDRAQRKHVESELQS